MAKTPINRPAPPADLHPCQSRGPGATQSNEGGVDSPNPGHGRASAHSRRSAFRHGPQALAKILWSGICAHAQTWPPPADPHRCQSRGTGATESNEGDVDAPGSDHGPDSRTGGGGCSGRSVLRHAPSRAWRPLGCRPRSPGSPGAARGLHIPACRGAGGARRGAVSQSRTVNICISRSRLANGGRVRRRRGRRREAGAGSAAAPCP